MADSGSLLRYLLSSSVVEAQARHKDFKRSETNNQDSFRVSRPHIGRSVLVSQFSQVFVRFPNFEEYTGKYPGSGKDLDYSKIRAHLPQTPKTCRWCMPWYTLLALSHLQDPWGRATALMPLSQCMRLAFSSNQTVRKIMQEVFRKKK